MPDSTYILLDFGDGKRLEQWGSYRLIRPDPTARGKPSQPELWINADAIYEGEKGKGRFAARRPLPERWTVNFDDVSLQIRLAPYKHTGVFPEQVANWRWMRVQAQKSRRALSVLNLFAYTGGASIALAKDGHHVTHVDSSRPALTWAKENAALNGLSPSAIRWMPEDAAKFVARERRRGASYDAIILDPPAYGHGPAGTTWRVARDLAPILEQCATLMSASPAFLLLNGYAQGDSAASFHRLLTGILKNKTPHLRFQIAAEELTLRAVDGRTLSTGIVARCAFRQG